MTIFNETLGEIVDAGPATWTTRSCDELARALACSAEEAGRHLCSFCTVVGGWVRGGKREDFAGRRAWLDEAADPFLRQIRPEVIVGIVERLPNLAEQISIIDLLSRHPTRDSLAKSIRSAGEVLAKAASFEEPADVEERARLGSHLRTLVRAIGVALGTRNQAEEIATLLGQVPSWLLSEFWSSLGALEDFEAYGLDLAYALPICCPHVIPSLAAAWASTRHQRLAVLLGHLAQLQGGPPRKTAQHKLLRTLPTTDQIGMFAAALEAKVHESDAALARQTRSMFDAARDRTRDMADLVRSYLNAVPQNHEDVFDLLSARGDPPGHSIGEWGLGGVTIVERSSMRANSRHVTQRYDVSPPDFDPKHVLRALSAEASIELVLRQPSPEFALKYLRLLASASNPNTGRVCDELCGRPAFVQKLMAADGTMAACVFDGVDGLGRQSARLKGLIAELTPILLPRVPSELLAHPAIFHDLLHRDRRDLVQQVVSKRVTEARSLKQIGELARSALETGLFRRGEFETLLDGVDVASLSLGSTPSIAAAADWANQMTFVAQKTPAFAQRVIRACHVSSFAIVFSWERFALSEEHESQWSMQSRLALKSMIVTRWMTQEPTVAAEALRTNLNRDFWLMFYVGLHDAGGREPMLSGGAIAGKAWLDAVRIATPELVSDYLTALLRFARVAYDFRHTTLTLANAVGFVAWWLRGHEMMADEELWVTLEARIGKAAADDMEAVAAVGCAVLPGPPERLRQMRERVAIALRDRMSRSQFISYSGNLQQFKELLDRDAPDLSETMPWAESKGVARLGPRP